MTMLRTILSGVLTCSAPLAASQDAEDPSRGWAARAMFKDLARALDSGAQAGRIYYNSDRCAKFGASPPMPQPHAQPQAPGSTGLAAVRDVFRGDASVTISGETAGIVRVRVGAVPDAILQTRIARLDLDGDDPFNPDDVITAIEHTPEMQAEMRRLGVQELQIIIDHIVQPADPDVPHVPATMTNLTAEEALDVMARSFHMLVIYEACPQSGQFHIDYWALDDA